MACTVYCLVPHQEQLEKVVHRLRDAGIETARICIVSRPQWQGPSAAPETAQIGMHALWSWPLASAVAWWQWAAGEDDGVDNPAGLIPLARYERGKWI